MLAHRHVGWTPCLARLARAPLPSAPRACMGTSPDVRVRFAPSPTGFLHLGGLRTALYNYLYAKKHGGTFILRIEDTDQSREVPGSAESIEKTLSWAGLECDESPLKGGAHGPYFQSKRLDRYKTHIKELLDGNLAYECFCSSERLEAMRLAQQKAGAPVMYDRHCLRTYSKEKRKEMAEQGLAHTVRLLVPSQGETTFSDKVYGSITYPNASIDDQVLVKSDGFPTYHFANVVDDHLMRISHIFRGQEWLSSSAKHQILYNYFGWKAPLFVHLPLLLNLDKSKLSKRQGDVFVEQFRDVGYLPEALINFVAFLGWSPSDTREFFTLPELVQAFSIEGLNKAGAVVDFQKLRFVNKHFLGLYPSEYGPGKHRETRELLLAALKRHFGERLASVPARRLDDEYLHRVIHAMKERVSLVTEIPSFAPYFWVDAVYDKEYGDKACVPGFQALLPELVALIRNTQESFVSKEFSAALKQLASRHQLSQSAVLEGVRFVVTGTKSGTSVMKTLDVLGKDVVLARMEDESRWRKQ